MIVLIILVIRLKFPFSAPYKNQTIRGFLDFSDVSESIKKEHWHGIR